MLELCSRIKNYFHNIWSNRDIYSFVDTELELKRNHELIPDKDKHITVKVECNDNDDDDKDNAMNIIFVDPELELKNKQNCGLTLNKNKHIIVKVDYNYSNDIMNIIFADFDGITLHSQNLGYLSREYVSYRCEKYWKIKKLYNQIYCIFDRYFAMFFNVGTGVRKMVYCKYKSIIDVTIQNKNIKICSRVPGYSNSTHFVKTLSFSDNLDVLVNDIDTVENDNFHTYLVQKK
jgi:hypothetical protein